MGIIPQRSARESRSPNAHSDMKQGSVKRMEVRSDCVLKLWVGVRDFRYPFVGIFKTLFIYLSCIVSVTDSLPMAKAEQSSVQATLVRTIPLPNASSSIAWSQDGERLAAIHNNGGSISVWDKSGQLLRTIKRDETLGPYNGQIEFLPHSHLLLGPAPTNEPGRQPNILALWNVDSGEIARTVEGPNPADRFQGNRPIALTMTPGGLYVAVFPLSRDGLLVYSTADWRLVAQVKIKRSDIPLDYRNDKTPPDRLQQLWCFTLSVQNQLAISLALGVVLSDPLSSSSLTGFVPSYNEYNNFRDGRPSGALAYSPDGRLLALGISLSIADSARDRAEKAGGETQAMKADLAYLKIWDVQAKKFVAFDPSIGAPRDLKWSSDGRYLVAVTQDHRLRVYEPVEHGGEPQFDMKLDGAPFRTATSPTTGEWAVLIDSIGRRPAIEFYKIEAVR
jgi:WD40 repeat protein